MGWRVIIGESPKLGVCIKWQTRDTFQCISMLQKLIYANRNSLNLVTTLQSNCYDYRSSEQKSIKQKKIDKFFYTKFHKALCSSQNTVLEHTKFWNKNLISFLLMNLMNSHRIAKLLISAMKKKSILISTSGPNGRKQQTKMQNARSAKKHSFCKKKQFFNHRVDGSNLELLRTRFFKEN